MKQILPKNVSKLIKHYKNLKIGNHTITTPYFQGLNRPNKRPVYSGKGLPQEIEQEAIRLFSNKNKNLRNIDSPTLRLYLVMAGLGIDCSGFAVRVLDELLKERKGISIKEALKPLPNTLSARVLFSLRPYTNLSSNAITSEINCIKININETQPGDLIRFGDFHLAVITSVKKSNGEVSEIEYHHSTSDYLDRHGVRSGSIIITNPNDSLDNQKWTENYQGRNWTYEDYKRVDKRDKGIRRLRALL